MKPPSNLIAALAVVILSFPAAAQQPSGTVTPAPQIPQRVRISRGVAQGLLVRRVNPVYPPLARQARISGTVVLRVLIGTDGSTESLTLVSGHPMLAPAVIEAVKQWKYQPYLLNGQPTKVDTEVQVNFELAPPSAADAVASGLSGSGGAFAAVTPEAALSQVLNKYPGLLTEFGQLLEKLQRNIQFPEARGQSHLMPMLPESTVLYAAFPNYGDAVHQAQTIFQQEVQQSPVLRAWWQQADSGANGTKVEDSLEKAYQLSQYLGDEIVVSGGNEMIKSGAAKDPSLLIVAEVRKPGLKDFLEQMTKQFAGKSEPAVRVLDDQELAAAKDTLPAQQLLILVRPDLLVATSDLATLRNFVAQLNTGSREFAVTPFGRRLEQAYEGGASIVGAVDLQKILKQVPSANDQSRMMLQRTGFADMQYLVWEHKSVAGHATSQMELSFTGPRRGVASWLAAPGPMSSLDFVSPKAIMAATVRLKDPAEIFEDVKNLSTASDPKAFASVAQMEQILKLSFKEDLFRHLSGEVTCELDSVTPPNAAWRVILGVNDPDRLQATLSTLLTTMHVSAPQSQEEGVTYHTLRIPSSQKMIEINYAFADRYLVIASSREAIAEAIRLRQSGESLSMSSKFLASLPRGHGSEASALFYEDPTAVTALSLRQAFPEVAQSLSQTTSASPAAVISAYGEESAIREVSRSGAVDAGAVMVVAAIAIPNLLRARIAANESSAVDTIRTANTAQLIYSTSYPQRGFARDLATLGPPPGGGNTPSPDHASVIDATLGNASCTAGTWCTKSGFRFSVAAVCKTQQCEQFVVVGTPVSGSTGRRSFCSTSDAIVRSKNGPPLTSPVSVSECQSWTPLQ
jgi:TonB family protein